MFAEQPLTCLRILIANARTERERVLFLIRVSGNCNFLSAPRLLGKRLPFSPYDRILPDLSSLFPFFFFFARKNVCSLQSSRFSHLATNILLKQSDWWGFCSKVRGVLSMKGTVVQKRKKSRQVSVPFRLKADEGKVPGKRLKCFERAHLSGENHSSPHSKYSLILVAFLPPKKMTVFPTSHVPVPFLNSRDSFFAKKR